MVKKKNFNANLYAAFLEGKTKEEENRAVLATMMRNPGLILEINLASAITKAGAATKG